MKKRAIVSLKSFLSRKQDEMVKAAMARKFNYIRRLKSVLGLFRANIEFRKAYRRKIVESDILYKKAVLSRFFTVLKDVD